MSKKSIQICSTETIADPGSYGFSMEFWGEQVEGFLVKSDGQFYAYRNSCPHTGAPLDWVEHQFLDIDGELIQCAMHDARFLIESGECVFGPCPGDALQSLSIEVVDQKIYLLDK